MSNIVPQNPVSPTQVIRDLSRFKYCPSAIKTVHLRHLQEMMAGRVDLVDASNPFTYLMEVSCLNTAHFLQETAILTRRTYPRLAMQDSDLYLHMSDVDYLGRFAEPAQAYVTFNILFSDFSRNASNQIVLDSNGNPISSIYALQIPRMYQVNVGDHVFTLLYPILITQHQGGVIDIRYEANTQVSAIQNLRSAHIDFEVLPRINNETWLQFKVPMLEVDVQSNEFTINKSKLFRERIQIVDGRQFYYAEVFYKINAGDTEWRSMIVTHTEEVYDPNEPTICAKILPTNNQVEFMIPSNYTLQGLGELVRIDVYTTKGVIDTNFSDFRVSDFSTSFNPVDKARDLKAEAATIEKITKIVTINGRVHGGKDQMSFERLKAAVIDNSIGDRKIPVSLNQLEFESLQTGLRLIKNVDTITNRIFHLEMQIPSPEERYPISKLNMEMGSIYSTLDDLEATEQVFQPTLGRYVVPQNSLFIYEDGQLRLLSRNEVEGLENLPSGLLIEETNTNQYLALYYHYIIDVRDGTADLRAYDFSFPEINNFSFKNFNITAQFSINTTAIEVVKVDTGFNVKVISNIKLYGDAVDISDLTNVDCHLMYRDPGGDARFFHDPISVIENPDTGAFEYVFHIESLFEVESGEKLQLNSFKNELGVDTTIFVDLNALVNIAYTINYATGTRPVGYVADAVDSVIGESYILPTSTTKGAVTLEEFEFKFGEHLQALSRRVRTTATAPGYKTYTSDVFMTHDVEVLTNADLYDGDISELDGNELTTPILKYIPDPNDPEAEGEHVLMTHVLNRVGDPVLDNDGEPVIKYSEGDVVLGPNQQPELIDDPEIDRAFTFLLTDYRSILVNNEEYLGYMRFVRERITGTIVNNVQLLIDQLLENTEAYVILPSTLTYVQVEIDGQMVSNIPTAQSFDVRVFIRSDVNDNEETRESIYYTIIQTIDDKLTAQTVSIADITSELLSQLGEFVESIKISGLTDSNAEYVRILSTTGNLTLKKRLVTEPNRRLNLIEDITVSFVVID